MKVYIAGKVSKDSHFGTHHWRDEFCSELSKLSGMQLENLDPLDGARAATPQQIFSNCVKQINESELLIVYLSDDISVGGSQEILIAKYLGKPVIGFAPHGGKFNGATREMLGKVIKDFKDPFVFSTCDSVCGATEDVAEVIKNITQLKKTSFQVLVENALK